MTKLLTNTNRLHAAEQVLESISEPANTVYYLFVGDHSDHSNTELQPVYEREQTNIDTYRNMIFGKRVEGVDSKLMIRNIPYVSNTVYDHYDDADEFITLKDFFVVVNETSFYHVYKCLDNNEGAVSTVSPDISHITGSNTFIYQTSDGYRWKYMFTADSANVVKFETENFFPVIPNTSVSDLAVDGSIDVILVEGEGRGYDNYSTGTFDASNIKINGDTLLYGLSNASSSVVNSFYTGCSIYLSSGTGSGQYRTISDYYANSVGKYLVLDTEFSTLPDGTTEYEIYPNIQINGDGRETVTAVARGLVNALASNSIYRVEMLNRGAGYQYHTANVVANSVVGVTANAIVRPVYGPFGGHGYDPAEELYCKHLTFTVQVSNTESNTIPIDNGFQQIGILKDPMFANVVIDWSTSNGSFLAEELVYKISPVKIEANCTVVIASQNVDCAAADFENQFSSGDFVYLNSGTGLAHQVTQVDSVTNSSQLILSVNAYFSCTETTIYQANITGQGIVELANSTHLTLANATGQIVATDTLVGVSTGAQIIANSIFRNNVEKSFDTFINMYKYEGILDSGTFQENEVIYQGNLTTSNALLHSISNDGGSITVYTTNQVGQFMADGANSIVGSNSGATASLTEAWVPELVFNSGDILFLQNIEKVTRSANTNETFQIIFEF